MTTKQERDWMNAVASFGCVVCFNLGHGDTPAMVHHCGTGMGGVRDHMFTIGLCHLHHQGADGIHTLGRKKWQARFGTEQELIDQLKENLGYEI